MYSPCSACKFLRRKCTQDCVFAPYFPPHLPMKFISVHKVYGASTVAKLLSELPVSERRDAANSLAFEAEARLNDPVYGCVGSIAILQHRLKQVQTDLLAAKQELATYMGPSSANMPVLNPGYMQMQQLQTLGGQVMPSNMQPLMSGHQGPGNAEQQQQLYQQKLYQAQQQQLAEAAREQEMLRNFELQQLYQQQLLQQHQHQQSMESLSFNRGFDDGAGPSEQVNTGGFTHLTGPAEAMTPSLALGGLYEEQLLVQQQEQHPHHQLLVQQQEQHHHQLLVQQQQLQPPLMPHQLLDQHQPQPPQLQPQSPQLQPQPQQPHGDGGEEGRGIGSLLTIY